MSIIPNLARQIMIENGNRSRDAEVDHPPVVLLQSPNLRCQWFLNEIDEHDTELVYGLYLKEGNPPVYDYFSIMDLDRASRSGELIRNQRFVGDAPLSVYAARGAIAA